MMQNRYSLKGEVGLGLRVTGRKTFLGFTARFILRSLAMLLLFGTGANGEIPRERWALVGTVWGAGLRYLPSQHTNIETRLSYGEGIAASLRGGLQTNKEGWKVQPLAGLELSILAPYQGKGEHAQALALFVGGETRLSKHFAVQLDLGPALLRIQNNGKKEDNWEYQNVFNVSANYYFGKAVR